MNPTRKHRHGPGANKCIWCGSTANGATCIHTNMQYEHSNDHQALLDAVLAQMRLRPDSVHGPDHWRQVALNGLLLARTTGADPEVVRLFALFHDSRRFNEWTDPDHGARGAELACAWHGVKYDLDVECLESLALACRNHTIASKTTGNATVDTCIDADRLDLVRVGIMPDPARLLTSAAQDLVRRALSAGVTLWDFRDFMIRSFMNRQTMAFGFDVDEV